MELRLCTVYTFLHLVDRVARSLLLLREELVMNKMLSRLPLLVVGLPQFLANEVEMEVCISLCKPPTSYENIFHSFYRFSFCSACQ